MALILYICLHRKAHFILENPVNSLVGPSKGLIHLYIKFTIHSNMVISVAIPEIFHHPRLRQLLTLRGSYEVNTWLGMFGAATWKPVRLVSTSLCVEKLYRIRFGKEDLFSMFIYSAHMFVEQVCICLYQDCNNNIPCILC